jgi:hypothetical protein
MKLRKIVFFVFFWGYFGMSCSPNIVGTYTDGFATSIKVAADSTFKEQFVRGVSGPIYLEGRWEKLSWCKYRFIPLSAHPEYPSVKTEIYSMDCFGRLRLRKAKYFRINKKYNTNF